ncbi:MAG: glycosyltransferase family 2 protein [Gemmatimonadaceae bacterium]
MPSASVVIPTYRRRDDAVRVVQMLAKQTIPSSEYEVVVVVNGPDDGTRDALAAIEVPFALRVLHRETPGLAAARNAGVADARGDVVIILDDDMEPAAGFVAAHVAAHADGEPKAVMGPVPIAMSDATSAPSAYVGAKFDRHLAWLARNGGPATARDFYGGNLSLPRDVFVRIAGFDERFTQYGNEDVELSLRLASAGVPIVYEPSAVAMQRYDKDFAALAADTLAKGRTAVQLERLHPEARAQLKLGAWREQPFLRRLFVGVLLAATRAVPAVRGAVARGMSVLGEHRRALALRLYPPVLDYFYWCGVREAQRDIEGGAP